MGSLTLRRRKQMGSGYHILVWGNFGAGLVLLAPGLHTEGKDLYGNPRNWWACSDDTTDDEIAEKHALDAKYGANYRILRDE